MRTAALKHLQPWLPLRRGRRSARRGVAALEFALASPMLILMLLSMYDIANGWLAWRRLTAAAQSVGQIATMLAVNADGTNSLTYDQAWRSSTAVYAAMPEMLVTGARYGVTLSQVLFTSASACNGTICAAHVDWSQAMLGVAAPRPCGALSATATADDAAPGPTVMPESAFQAAPVLVADVTYAFKPLFLGGVVGPISMARSSYFPARSGSSNQAITYSGPNAQCPAFREPEAEKKADQ